MKISIDNVLVVSNLSDEQSRILKSEFTIDNPEYHKKKRLGLWLGKTPRNLALYQMRGRDLVLPYGCLDSILRHGFELEDLDIRIHAPLACHHAKAIELYDYQRRAVDKLKQSTGGILKAPPGSGKTQMGLALAIEWGYKTLWICHTGDLLQQSLKRALRYVPKDKIGTITAGKVNLGEFLTIATVQTLANLDLAELKDQFGLIIVDECHRVSGSPTLTTQYYRVLNKLSAYKFGLSGTVHRADGMIKATETMLGNVIHEVDEDETKSVTVKPTVQIKQTGIHITDACLNEDGTLNYAAMLKYLADNENRNNQILTSIRSTRSVLVLSDRISQLDYLEKRCKQLGLKVCKITGSTPIKQREKLLNAMRTGEKNLLLATYKLAKEGLDIPILDTLILATPQKDFAIVAQSVGRVCRKTDGKLDPVVIDFVDDIGVCKKHLKSRLKIYKEIGCKLS